jgi:hypothetical protein
MINCWFILCCAKLLGILVCLCLQFKLCNFVYIPDNLDRMVGVCALILSALQNITWY